MKSQERYCLVSHTFAPVYDADSEVLILGSFPSVKSREAQFYYGHPRNRFWDVVAVITGSSVPESIEEKKMLLLKNHIALWDVVQSCEIVGSSDSSIRHVTANDFRGILEEGKIRRIYGNGAKACRLYDQYVRKQIGMPIFPLPSTSPANAAWSLEKLIEAWKTVILDREAERSYRVN